MWSATIVVYFFFFVFFTRHHLSEKYSAARVRHRSMNKLIFRIWHNDLTHIVHVYPYGWIGPNKRIRMLLITLIILLFQTSFYSRKSRNWQLFYLGTNSSFPLCVSILLLLLCCYTRQTFTTYLLSTIVIIRWSVRMLFVRLMLDTWSKLYSSFVIFI